MDDIKQTEPQITDIQNIMMVTTIDKARELLKKEVFDEMVLVTNWIPYNGNSEGMTFEKRNKKTKFFEPELLKPIIKDVKVDWFYPKDKILSALKILDIMGWKSPEMYCPKKAYPMMIKSGNLKNSVILIAPRIEAKI